ncbi:hypothetical protein OGH69_10295 [Flavobacterium sp. MFBS3-15]|uniref:hypothetical protein n=1 Tax=Flavobacterium sp. MFBS3-15 TaxID=2989816 RepID=UPI002236A071|nr:hypothetical protein [Flavobacterium sp. MFBS3-15]MCW4469355.1 hypothetical protein [Flavobacterium sp. MFBS3-15]
MKSKITIILLLLCSLASAQGRKALRGTVNSGGVGVPNVFVINRQTGDETKTDSQGNFNIAAKAGDRMAVYGEQIETRDFSVTEDSFRYTPFTVSVDYKATELEEVVVEDEKKDPYAQGQQGRLAKHTPQERKAVAGARIGPRFNDPTVQGAAINGDGIINLFTGKRKAIKRALEMERREKLITSFKGMYDEVVLNEEFGIPKENIDGFIYYCIENKDMAKAIEANDKPKAEELMPDLVLEFIDNIKSKK